MFVFVLRIWNTNSRHQGPPNFDIWEIVYFEELPDEMFDIDLSDDPTTLIAVNTPLYDPNYGMNAEGLTQEQACHRILQEFWQAVNEQDLDRIRTLFPHSAGWSDEVLMSNIGGDQEPPELIEMGQIYQSEIGPIVPCIIQLEDAKKVVDMIVLFRKIDGKSSCVVYHIKGTPQPVE